MQTTPKVYGLSGLTAVLGLLALLVGLIVMVLLPSIRYAAWSLLALGMLLLITAFIMDFRRVSRALTGRRGTFGTGTTVMVSIFIGITLLVNAISIGNYKRFDLTGVAQFTLTSQTKEVLSELDTPVQALCFFIPNDPYGIGNYATNLLTEYQNYTDQLGKELIDPDEHPDQARQYGITQYQTVVLESDNHRRSVLPQEIAEQAEHAFTSAILEVTGIVQKKLYFLTGHGETSIHSAYSYAKEGLLDHLYKVDTLNLSDNLSIPEDCAALIIVAPKRSLTSSEVETIEHYLRTGGQVMLLTNPSPPQGIHQLLSPWGIEIEDGTVIDRSSFVDPSKDIPLVTRERCTFGLPKTFFPGATAVIHHEEEVEGGAQMLVLVWTSQDSWLERDFKADEEPEFNEGIDREGPLALGVLIAAPPMDKPEGESPEDGKLTRLVVIGDSDFASKQHFNDGYNSDLFLASENWLTEETYQI